MAAFVKGLQHVTALRVLPYHGYAESKYAALGMEYTLAHLVPPTTEEIACVVEKMRCMGVNACTF